MKNRPLNQISGVNVLDRLRALAAQERGVTAEMLTCIAEAESGGDFRAEGYSSMYAWCVGELHLSEQSAFKRIRAARLARQYPVLLEAIADGRLNLSALTLLAPCLTGENIEELVAFATHRRKRELERIIADRRAHPDLPEGLVQLSPGRVGDRVTPLSPGRYGAQFTMNETTNQMLEYAQELLSHVLPVREIAGVFERALQALIPQLEKQKFAAADHPLAEARPTHSARHIPARVKEAVWRRDGGACTFVGENGHVCGERWMTEFDHVQEVACGGEATVDKVRVLCRAHNQYAAECHFGPEFMEQKRREAAAAREAARAVAAEEARVREEAKARADEEARVRNEAEASAKARIDEMIPYLRKLRFTAEEARARAQGACEFLPDGSLEERVTSAISRSYARQPKSAVAA